MLKMRRPEFFNRVFLEEKKKMSAVGETNKRERENDEEKEEIGAKQAKVIAPKIQLTKIISGGQSGADQAALKAAQQLGLSTGGWAPRGFRTSLGPNPELGTKYFLQELVQDEKVPLVADYVTRSKKNVDESDATVAFRLHFSVGTDKTIGYCVTRKWTTVYDRFAFSRGFIKVHRPVLIITDAISLEKHRDEVVRQRDAQRLREFLIEHNVKTLNVAGHREDGRDPTWEQRITDFLVFALSNVN